MARHKNLQLGPVKKIGFQCGCAFELKEDAEGHQSGKATVCDEHWNILGDSSVKQLIRSAIPTTQDE